MTASSPSRLMQIVRFLLAVNGLAWIGITVATASLFWARPEGPAPLVLLLALMLGNAGVLLFLGWRLGTAGSWLWIFSMAWIALNLVLSFTDDIGLPDLLSGGVNLLTFALLISAWREYRSEG